MTHWYMLVDYSSRCKSTRLYASTWPSNSFMLLLILTQRYTVYVVKLELDWIQQRNSAGVILLTAKESMPCNIATLIWHGLVWNRVNWHLIGLPCSSMQCYSIISIHDGCFKLQLLKYFINHRARLFKVEQSRSFLLYNPPIEKGFDAPAVTFT